jgi:hypothetical protein
MKRLACVLGVVVICGCAADVEETEVEEMTADDALEEELAWPPREPREVAGLFGRVFCKESEQGPACVQKCLAKGISCTYAAYYPKDPNVPNGLLYACNKLPPFAAFCSYTYQNGDNCHFAQGRLPPYICLIHSPQ